MDKYAYYTLIWTNLAVPVDAAVAQMIDGLMTLIGTPFKLCVLAYLIAMLVIAAGSPDEAAFTRFFRQLGMAAIVYTLATSVGTFDYYVTGMIHGVVDGVSRAIAIGLNQGGGTLNADSFDIIGSRAFSVGVAVFKNLPSFSLKAIPLAIIVVIYWFLSFAAISIMFAIYLVSYVLTSFLIAVGPLFVALYFFPYSRRWFDGWVRSVATCVLVQIFTAALAVMFILVLTTILNMQATNLRGTQLAQVDGGVVIGQMMLLVIISLACLIFGILSVSVSFVAANIAGGIHSETSRIPAMSLGGSPAPASATPSAAASHAGGDGPPQAGAGAGRVDAGREYAFNRHVGSAP